ncbi:hypothetical protein E2562_033735, partial [Oryza meyeriana var. granulata]
IWPPAVSPSPLPPSIAARARGIPPALSRATPGRRLSSSPASYSSPLDVLLPPL